MFCLRPLVTRNISSVHKIKYLLCQPEYLYYIDKIFKKADQFNRSSVSLGKSTDEIKN